LFALISRSFSKVASLSLFFRGICMRPPSLNKRSTAALDGKVVVV